MEFSSITFFFISVYARTGYESYLFSRPDLCDLMVARIPDHKLLMNKQVTKIRDSDMANKAATVECKDGSTYDVHLVIGAGKMKRHFFFFFLTFDQS